MTRTARYAAVKARTDLTDSQLLVAAEAFTREGEYELAEQWRMAWAVRCVDWPNEKREEVDVGEPGEGSAPVLQGAE